MSDENLSTRFKEAYASSGLSKSETAQNLNVSPKTVANYLSGKTVPKEGVVLRLESLIGDQKISMNALGMLDFTSPVKVQHVEPRVEVTEKQSEFNDLTLKNINSQNAGAILQFLRGSSEYADLKRSAYCYVALGNTWQALIAARSAEDVIGSVDKDPQLSEIIARIHTLQNENNKRIIAKEDAEIAVCVQRGYKFLAAGENEHALNCFHKAEKINHAAPSPLIGMIRARISMGHLDGAFGIFNRLPLQKCKLGEVRELLLELDQAIKVLPEIYNQDQWAIMKKKIEDNLNKLPAQQGDGNEENTLL